MGLFRNAVLSLVATAALSGCAPVQTPHLETKVEEECGLTGDPFTLSVEEVDALTQRYDVHFPSSPHVIDTAREELSHRLYSEFRESGIGGFDGSIDVLFRSLESSFGVKGAHVLVTSAVDAQNAALYKQFVEEAAANENSPTQFFHINAAPEISGPDVAAGLRINGYAVPGTTVLDTMHTIVDLDPADLSLDSFTGFVHTYGSVSEALWRIDRLFPDPGIPNYRLLTTEFLTSTQYLHAMEEGRGISFVEYAHRELERARASGKRALLSVGASWCPPCVNQHDDLERAARENQDLVVLEILTDVEYIGPHAFASFTHLFKPSGISTGVPTIFVFNEDGKHLPAAESVYDLETALAIFDNPPSKSSLERRASTIALFNQAAYETRDETLVSEPFILVGNHEIKRSMEYSENLAALIGWSRPPRDLYNMRPGFYELFNHIGTLTGVEFDYPDREVISSLAMFSADYSLENPRVGDLLDLARGFYQDRLEHRPLETDVITRVLDSFDTYERKLAEAGGADTILPSIYAAARMQVGEREPVIVKSNDDVSQLLEETIDVHLDGKPPYSLIPYSRVEDIPLLEHFRWDIKETPTTEMATRPEGGYVVVFN